MNLSRRGFLNAMLAAGVGAAIVRSGIIMPIKPSLFMPPRGLQITGGEPGSMFTITGQDVEGQRITEVIYLTADMRGFTQPALSFKSIDGASIMPHLGSVLGASAASLTYGDRVLATVGHSGGEMTYWQIITPLVLDAAS